MTRYAFTRAPWPGRASLRPADLPPVARVPVRRVLACRWERCPVTGALSCRWEVAKPDLTVVEGPRRERGQPPSRLPHAA